MSNSKKHIDHITPEVIEQYLQDKLSDAQRHQVEKLMLNSDFDAEAMEGFESISADELKSDFQELNQKLDQRLSSSGKSKAIYWRIAAAISILAVSGFIVFLLIDKTSEDKQISQVETPEEIIPPVKPEESSAFEERMEMPAENEAVNQQDATDEPEPIEPQNENIEVYIAEEDAEQEVEAEELSEDIENEVRKIEENIAARSQPVPAHIPLEKKVSGTVVTANDKKPLAGVNLVVKGTSTGTVTDIEGNFKIAIPQNSDSTLVASFIGLKSQTIDVSGKEEIDIEMNPDVAELSEVMVTRARRSEKKVLGDVTLDEEAMNLAKPSKENYDIYLEENLQYPEEETKHGEVTLSFFVNPDSTFSDFSVEKSLGPAFDKEAIRVIKEGPKWIPAAENGKAVRQRVELVIKFEKP